MTSRSEIDGEINELRRAFYADAVRTAPPREEWRQRRQELWAENARNGADYLQPWLAIFELGLDWLGEVHLGLNHEQELGPRDPRCRVPWALIGSATAFGWALRHACLTGFDTPGRALLRTYVESLFLCLAVLYDRSLSDLYQAADTDEKVVTFWHTHASPKNLHRRVIEIEKSLGFDAAHIQEMTAWRRREYEVMSQSSHLSYIAACMTCVPVSIEDEEIHRMGIFGRASANSRRTIGYAARTAWYFCRLSHGKILGVPGDGESLLTLNKDDETHQAIVIGRDVLSAITRKHWAVDA
jgi:hypothetical protein